MSFSLFIACFLVGQAGELRIRPLEQGRVEIIAPLNKGLEKLIAPGRLDFDDGQVHLRFSLVDPKTDKAGLGMFGTYERTDKDLTFRPRVSLEPGRLYRATFGPTEKPSLTKDYRVPLLNGGKAPTVVKLFPTADVLPANVLRFTIHFSQPMRGGKDIFKQIEILDADGNPISDAWLMDEQWDETGTILVIYIHPGRIKWGLVLREVLGPVLHPKRDYTLVVRGSIVDAAGQKVGTDFRKKFRTTGEDRVRIDLSQVKISAPILGSNEALHVRFLKAMDHKSLETLLSVVDEKGEKVAGKIEIGDDERRWSFTPTSGFKDGEYRVVVDSRFEDVAGNTPARPFDLDLDSPAPPAQRLEIPFRLIK